MDEYKTIIIEGGIGAGKSSLAGELASALGPNTLLQLEPDEKNNANPYLIRFGSDRKRWAFTMQVHLLQARFLMHLRAQMHVRAQAGHAVLDRSYYGDTSFAWLQLDMGDMSQDEFNTYSELYHNMTEFILHPNICIRLLVSPEVSLERIKRRMAEREGRKKGESFITLDYLIRLERAISRTVSILQEAGVVVFDMPWDMDRDTNEDRAVAVKAMADRINELPVRNTMLKLHRRII